MATVATTCCIAGGGPAGMMLGFLLARAGVDVTVLEKHADFLRDFRGDTIHPSTMQLMQELGLLDDFLKLPHTKERRIVARFGNQDVPIADFTHLPVAAPYIAFMPQWDFLDFLADRGRELPRFNLLMQAKATGLIRAGERVTGITAQTQDGETTITADLVVAADGRHSDLRQAGGFAVHEIGAPMDVLWFRLSRRESDAAQTFGQVARGRFAVMLNRGDYWQCAYVIPKGALEALRAAGLDAFKASLAELLPILADRTSEIASWDDLKLLSVAVDRLEQWWQPGLLCIGDAAHAMSPIGGVGVNLAIQDAVAAANRLAAPLREKRVTDSDLAAVQAHRTFPTKATQGVQVAIQNRVITPILAGSGPVQPPFPLKLLQWFPMLRRIPARLVGMGFRPEHIGPELAPRP
ncbi:FAD-dependent oxidoreductase [Hyphomicrobiales bacterium]|nr:FAD-dependent oxidoreductase [Hyphomicrobiales bacterium]CAH1702090.1 FAD-dependent oxidoreductase [Hyphomicrobiales bacterium]CAI0346246.1 FAD-dependent oxidoreductase [Hyphomicrobiales bacterium]